MSNQILYLDVDSISPHPDNPRKDLGDLAEMTESIKAMGILQNLTVVPIDNELYQKRRASKKAYTGGYTAVIGHRRLAAAKLAGLTEVPCAISDMDHKTQVGTMLLENIQRSALTTYEEAHGFQLMIDLGDTAQTIAEKMGFSDKTVRKRLFVASLDKEKSKSAFERGGTLEDHLKLQQLASEEKRNKVLDSVGTNNFNREFNNALAEELQERVAPEIIKHIEEFASPTNKHSWELKGYGYYGSCNYEDYEKNGKLDIKIPKKFSPEEYLYHKQLHRIEIYKRQEGQAAVKKMAELTPAEQEERREKRRKYKELKELSETAYQLRIGFARSFSRKNLTATELDALSELAFAAVCLGDRLEFNLYAKVEDLQIENAWQLHYSERKALAKAPGARLLLMSLYSTFRDSAKNRYYFASGEASAEKIGCYRKNEQLDAIYDCLCTLGYVMSDAEQALRDGTHELFASA